MLEVSAALRTFESQQLCGLCVSGEQGAPGVPGVLLRPGPGDGVMGWGLGLVQPPAPRGSRSSAGDGELEAET